MPASTTRYRFEYRVNDWATRFSISLCGRRSAFFVGLREDGSVRRIYFAPRGEEFDGAQKVQLAEAHPRWLLFQPYDEDNSAYLEWLGVDRPTMECWLGRRLEPGDFMDVRSTGTRDDWPDAWRVIVA